MHLAFFALTFIVFYLYSNSMFTSNTRQTKGKDNSSIEDTRNTILLLRLDYLANYRYSCPSPTHRPGPRSKALLRRACTHPLPTAIRQIGALNDPLQSSPSPPSAFV